MALEGVICIPTDIGLPLDIGGILVSDTQVPLLLDLVESLLPLFLGLGHCVLVSKEILAKIGEKEKEVTCYMPFIGSMLDFTFD